MWSCFRVRKNQTEKLEIYFQKLISTAERYSAAFFSILRKSGEFLPTLPKTNLQETTQKSKEKFHRFIA
jgi:hypothetical protein